MRKLKIKYSPKQKVVQSSKEQLKKEIRKIVGEYKKAKARKEKYWKKTEFWMIILTVAIVFSGFLTFSSINKQTQAIEGSYLSQVYLSGWSCPDNLKENIPIYLDLGIANYGKIPTQFSWKWSSQNVNITQLKDGNRYEVEKQEGPYILVPIEYKNNEQFKFNVKDLNVKLSNFALDSAEFKLNYFYLEKDKKGWKKKNIIQKTFFCGYKNENGTFNLVKSDNDKILSMMVSQKDYRFIWHNQDN